MAGGRPAISQDGPDVLLAVRVQPRAPRNQLVMAGERSRGPVPETITVRLTAPPVEGAANAACRAFLATIRVGPPMARQIPQISKWNPLDICVHLRSFAVAYSGAVAYSIFWRVTWNSKRPGVLRPPTKKEARSRSRCLASGSRAGKTSNPSRWPPEGMTTNRLKRLAWRLRRRGPASSAPARRSYISS
ncbi:MAG: DUF167 domain-containing protein [candidate division NC10 bacterium]|nr:DUF167 domain-containing protein [candidate division NC10 bacterium]